MTRFILQIIALLTMTIDHIGMIFISPKDIWYDILRNIGRLAFPLFAFFIGEGVKHSRNVWKYFFKILGIGLAIEVFFAIFKLISNAYVISNMNIFMTLALGLLVLILLKNKHWYIKPLAILPIAWLFYVQLYCKEVILFETFDVCLTFEYDFYGVFIIVVMGLFDNKWIKALGLIIVSLIFCNIGLLDHLGYNKFVLNSDGQHYGMIVAFLIILYNGKQGYKLPKWLTYLYYPAHLGLLYGIQILLSLI